MNRYPGWLLPVLALVVLGFVVWRIFARRFKSVEEVIEDGRLMALGQGHPLRYECPVCHAQPGKYCDPDLTYGAAWHLERWELGNGQLPRPPAA